MPQYRLTRLVRSTSSEIYLVWRDEQRIGQLDLHYADAVIHASLILEVDLSDEHAQDLYAQVDEDIVSSYAPSFDREDFIITVFRGEEILSFSYPPPGEATEES